MITWKQFYATTLIKVLGFNKTTNDNETYKICDNINKDQIIQHHSP